MDRVICRVDAVSEQESRPDSSFLDSPFQGELSRRLLEILAECASAEEAAMNRFGLVKVNSGHSPLFLTEEALRNRRAEQAENRTFFIDRAIEKKDVREAKEAKLHTNELLTKARREKKNGGVSLTTGRKLVQAINKEWMTGPVMKRRTYLNNTVYALHLPDEHYFSEDIERTRASKQDEEGVHLKLGRTWVWYVSLTEELQQASKGYSPPDRNFYGRPSRNIADSFVKSLFRLEKDVRRRLLTAWLEQLLFSNESEFTQGSPFREQVEIEAANLVGRKSVLWDDLVQVGLEAVWYKALPAWKPESARFLTFMPVVVRNAMIDYLRSIRAWARKDGKLPGIVSYDVYAESAVAHPASDDYGFVDLCMLIQSETGGEEFLAEAVYGIQMADDPKRAASRRYQCRQRVKKQLLAEESSLVSQTPVRPHKGSSALDTLHRPTYGS